MRLLAFSLLLTACGSPSTFPEEEYNDPSGSDDTGSPSTEDTGSTPTSDDTGTSDETAPPRDTGVPPADDGGPPPSECYREIWNPDASLADLKSAYSSSKWKTTALSALEKRYPDGYALLFAMKDDADLPRFANTSSFPALMESIDTMCHEEGHGWDFNSALKTPGKHVYWMRKDLALQAPKALGFFARNELLSYITDDATSLYDGTYLKGEQGSYDFIFLAEEATQYINGLACVTTVGSEVKTYGTSFRDGAAAHLLYVQWYLNRARTKYPTLYGKMKASTEWQKVIRYLWARGHFWTEQSKPFPSFGIKDKQIWVKVNAKENLAEIEQFTGEKPEVVACKP
jgi:hypothetical protein